MAEALKNKRQTAPSGYIGGVLQDTSCNLCGSRESQNMAIIIKNGQQHLFVQCRSCRLVYMKSIPSPEDLTKFYQNSYRNECDPGSNPEMIDKGTSLRAKIYSQWVTRSFPEEPQQKRILDIGCATGNFLHILNGKGWDTHGIEPDPKYADYSRSQGITVHNSTLEQANLPANSFNVITAFHTIEHLYDPSTSLNRIRDLLSPNGTLFVVVPNVDNFRFKIDPRYRRWFFSPAHVYYFTPKTISRMLENAGLRVSSVTTVGLPFWLPGALNNIIKNVACSGWGEEIHVVASKQPADETD